MGTTTAQKKLFFNLKKLKNQIAPGQEGDLKDEHVEEISKRLAVKSSEVVNMNRRMMGHEKSLNDPIISGETDEWQDWLVDDSLDQELIVSQKQEYEDKKELLADAMKIDSIGAVTKPLQPAFLCMQTTSINAETVNDATVTTVALNAEIFDVNADFANSVFTAPVTGKYQFSCKVGIDTGSSSNTRFDQIVAQIATSNRIYYFDASGTVYTDSNDKGWSNGSMLADMDANDTATLRIYVKRNGGTGTTEIARSGDTAGLSTYMSGYLVA